MNEAFSMTLEYLKTRKQFGVPIGSFQALKHRAADEYVQTELARSAVYYAAMALDEQQEDAATAVSTAKAEDGGAAASHAAASRRPPAGPPSPIRGRSAAP